MRAYSYVLHNSMPTVQCVHKYACVCAQVRMCVCASVSMHDCVHLCYICINNVSLKLFGLMVYTVDPLVQSVL